MKMNNKMSLDNIKSKIILRVKKFEKIEVDNEENQLKNIENFYDVFHKKDLINIIKNNNLDFEYVSSEPEKFKFNTVYIRLDGGTAWLYGIK